MCLFICVVYQNIFFCFIYSVFFCIILSLIINLTNNARQNIKIIKNLIQIVDFAHIIALSTQKSQKF